MFSKLALGAATISAASAAGTAEWKGRAVYQVLTDRFAKSYGNENDGACSDLSNYCGGTWKGI
jgi:alpha-amylase